MVSAGPSIKIKTNKVKINTRTSRCKLAAADCEATSSTA
jgi:hypothetical protein